MNPRALDLYIRSVTTAALALIVLGIAGFQVIHTGEVGSSFGTFVGLVLGFYFGAHASLNGAGSRSRAEALAVQQATGLPAPTDDVSHRKREDGQ